MDLENVNGFSLRNFAKLNVVLGKNGCGKSHLLKNMESGLAPRVGTDLGIVRYISPERGGDLTLDTGVDQQISNTPTYLGKQRRRNQAAQFRQQSTSLFRQLEILTLREIEKGQFLPAYEKRTFDSTLEQLNTLLDRIEIKRHDQKVFSIHLRTTGDLIEPNAISSGEAELISLGIEFLSFVKEAPTGKPSLLLVDEPDVHLHPDLQHRLAEFMVKVFEGSQVTLILATHSTSLLYGISKASEAKVAFMRQGDQALSFKPVSDLERRILPIFGAHPLSNVFNESPLLLVEGEDDERIWQQAVRSAQGRIRLYPCEVGSIDNLAKYEREASDLMETIYDDATGYSIRDRDLAPEEIDDFRSIVRVRLNCRAAENLLLSDDVLESCETDWPSMQQMVNTWLEGNSTHQYYGVVTEFASDGFNRRDFHLKPIRNILVGLISNKPWEVLVGQCIARLTSDCSSDTEGSLRDFLGEKTCRCLIAL